jgi:hypothetical protein
MLFRTNPLLLFIWIHNVASQSVCFTNNNTELRAAVKDYVKSANKPAAASSLKYGYPIGSWCVDAVEDFSNVFKGASKFNEPLQWKTPVAKSMKSMFDSATNFNQPLTTFTTSMVTNFDSMFFFAQHFNQSLLNFDTSVSFDEPCARMK